MRKLSLHRETLRNLQDFELQPVAGGMRGDQLAGSYRNCTHSGESVCAGCITPGLEARMEMGMCGQGHAHPLAQQQGSMSGCCLDM